MIGNIRFSGTLGLKVTGWAEGSRKTVKQELISGDKLNFYRVDGGRFVPAELQNADVLTLRTRNINNDQIYLARIINLVKNVLKIPIAYEYKSLVLDDEDTLDFAQNIYGKQEESIL